MNDYLIDTHVLLRAIFQPDKLTGRVAGILKDPEQMVYISVVSFWEISIKYALDKIVLGNHRTPKELQALSLTAGYREKPLTCSEAATFHQLPRLAHRDPFDRMLIWQAICGNMTLISRDSAFSDYQDYGLKLIY